MSRTTPTSSFEYHARRVVPNRRSRLPHAAGGRGGGLHEGQRGTARDARRRAFPADCHRSSNGGRELRAEDILGLLSEGHRADRETSSNGGGPQRRCPHEAPFPK